MDQSNIALLKRHVFEARERLLEAGSSDVAIRTPTVEGFNSTPWGGLMMSITSKRDQHLQGKRILVTALDLEQREHRGIAVYSKALIRHLRRMGAEVWLLTQFKPMTSDLRQLPKETQRIIYSSRTLNELVHGKTLHISKLEQLIPFFTKFGNRYRRIRKSLKRVFVKTSYRSKELRSFKLNELSDNPNLRINRLDYLQYHLYSVYL